MNDFKKKNKYYVSISEAKTINFQIYDLNKLSYWDASILVFTH